MQAAADGIAAAAVSAGATATTLIAAAAAAAAAASSTAASFAATPITQVVCPVVEIAARPERDRTQAAAATLIFIPPT